MTPETAAGDGGLGEVREPRREDALPGELRPLRWSPGRGPVSDIEAGHRSTTVSLLGMLSLKLGRSLKWDAEEEVVVGDAEATAHLKRAYRAPWSYPDYA